MNPLFVELLTQDAYFGFKILHKSLLMDMAKIRLGVDVNSRSQI
jgi:hypothetical protein